MIHGLFQIMFCIFAVKTNCLDIILLFLPVVVLSHGWLSPPCCPSHLQLFHLLPAHSFTTLLRLLSFSNDIQFKTLVLALTTSKASKALITQGDGPLPAFWARFFILPMPLWSSIHLLSSLSPFWLINHEMNFSLQ